MEDVELNKNALILTDVFMPDDLCARCAEVEPRRDIFLRATPSPSSTFKTTKLFFCSLKCKKRFVVGWSAVNSVPDV